MRLLIALVLLVSFTTACGVASKKDTLAETIDENLVVDKIAKNTYVVKDRSFYDTNVLVAKMSDGSVIIVSSPIESIRTKSMLRWIQRSLKPKKLIAINSHFHADGTGGNEEYQKNNVEIWSSHLTANIYKERAVAMQASLAQFVKNKKMSDQVLKRKNLPATHFFDLEKTIEWNFDNEKVILKYPGPAHTEDNIVVYFPERRILFGGCMIRSLDWKSLGNLEDANLKMYYSSVKSLNKYNAIIVVPGHGRVGGKNLITHTMDLAKQLNQ